MLKHSLSLKGDPASLAIFNLEDADMMNRDGRYRARLRVPTGFMGKCIIHTGN